MPSRRRHRSWSSSSSSSSSSRSRSRSRRRYRRSRSSGRDRRRSRNRRWKRSFDRDQRISIDRDGKSSIDRDRKSSNRRRRSKDKILGERMQIRSVIASKMAAHIIGKSGKTIKRIRDKSKCFIDIGDPVNQCPYVLVTTRGNLENILDALYRIAQRTWEIEYNQDLKDIKRYDRHRRRSQEKSCPKEEYVVKILIPNTQVGAIIGKGGAVINSFRNRSHCTITVHDECLSGSSEKIIEVKGSPLELEKALELVLNELSKNRDTATPHIPFYSSRGRRSTSMSIPQMRGVSVPIQYPMSYMGGIPLMRGMPGMRGVPQMRTHTMGMQARGMGIPYFMNQYPISPYSSFPSYPPAPSATSAEIQTILIPVPDHLIGNVIGKKGTSIKEIRQVSNAKIKVDGETNQTGDRMITITGNEDAIETAIGMVYDIMNDAGPA